MQESFFVLIFALTFSISDHCPASWHPSVLYPKCYLVVVQKKTWFDAEEYCKSVASDGHLTSIANGFENSDIDSYADTVSGIFSSQLWIGALDINQNGNYSWIDGKPFGYTNWEPAQPDVSNQCASSKATTTRKWKTEDCGSENCFICESYAAASNPTTPPPHVPSCPSQWTYFNETQACYRVFFNAVTWNEAEQRCQSSSGGHLTSIHSDAENQFVSGMASEHIIDNYLCNQTWIGMQDLKHNRQWSWTDGSPVNYFHWSPGEPNNATGTACGIQHTGEYCVQLYSDVYNNGTDVHYHWNDLSCESPMRAFVCKSPST